MNRFIDSSTLQLCVVSAHFISICFYYPHCPHQPYLLVLVKKASELLCHADFFLNSSLTQVIMRIVVKENLARNLCDMLVEDIKLAVKWMDENPTRLAHMKVRERVVVALTLVSTTSSMYSILSFTHMVNLFRTNLLPSGTQ